MHRAVRTLLSKIPTIPLCFNARFRDMMLPKSLQIYTLLGYIGCVCNVTYSSFVASDNIVDGAVGCGSRVHAFYYGWYGNLKTDGKWMHWDHEMLPHWNPSVDKLFPKKKYIPPNDFGASFAPERGLYSCLHLPSVKNQLLELKEAGVDTVSFSWWGRASNPNAHDGQGVGTDDRLPVMMEAANSVGIQVNIHIEPYEGRSAESVLEDLEYIFAHYGNQQSFYRDAARFHRPMFYIYDSYHTPSEQWARLFSKTGDLSIRGTELDSDFIALMLDSSDKDFILQSYFDGFYTYFASNGFSFASTWQNWEGLARWASQNSLIFIPSVAPGYNDLRLRPWNHGASRKRDGGRYYDQSWQYAMDASPPIVSITSYNEWGEGTQIEPAVPYTTAEGIKLEDYSPHEAKFYLNKTREWTEKFCSRMTVSPLIDEL